MEKPKGKAKKRKRKRQTVWRKILEKELELNDIALFNERLGAHMVTEAYELEKKRQRQGKLDYVR